MRGSTLAGSVYSPDRVQRLEALMVSNSAAVRAGKDALIQGRYQESVQILEAYCHPSSSEQVGDPERTEALMILIRAYQQIGNIEAARGLCEQLGQHPDSKVADWGKKFLLRLPPPSVLAVAPETVASAPPPPPPKVSNASQRASPSGVKLAITPLALPLPWVLKLTVGISVGVIFVLGLLWINGLFRYNLPWVAKGFITLSLTANVAAAAYFLTPLILDYLQNWLFKVRWVSLTEIEQRSPKVGQLVSQVGQQQHLKLPRFGIIPDANPVIFAYGSHRDHSRIVLSQGILNRLEADEIASLIAHQLGRIVNGDCSALTLAAFPAQLFYAIYALVVRWGQGRNGRQDLIGHLALPAYVVYVALTYPLFFLSRTGAYYGDRFAAELTGNPNALARALVKIAHGLLQEGKKRQLPSYLVDGSRLMGIYDPKTAIATGLAYQSIKSEQGSHQPLSAVFGWDLFNPWARWMEANSSHPLPGKRIRALATYAERLRLTPEFGMAEVSHISQQLDSKHLKGKFYWDLAIYGAEVVGLVAGWMVGLILFFVIDRPPTLIYGSAMIGFGLGMGVKAILIFPRRQQATPADMLTLMSDVYASPVRSQPVLLEGELFGQRQAMYQLGSELRLQDATGMIPVRFTSRFGPLGNLLSGLQQAGYAAPKGIRTFLGSRVQVQGWLRRGITPWLDLSQINHPSGKKGASHHQVWLCIFALGMVVSGALVILYWHRLPPLSWYTVQKLLRLKPSY
ncbi:MAG: M48 family metalloprotease [Cyanobacteriota bacterium]|nr:M48 family metalloprotease [Cyanobacteriota bacterium]